jgi:alkyl hydroperoxide reductase subunit AhpC
MEIPHIIALRKIINKDKLAILAVSLLSKQNTLRMVKDFVAENERINYPVLAVDSSVVPQPYNTVDEIPCSFFIDPQGKIKLATVNTLQLGEMKRILQAQWP